MFYYSCGSKFDVDVCSKYFQSYNGYIVFMSGELCLIYNYDSSLGRFTLNACVESMIPNKHKKGGQSSVRFGRIANNIRERYIITISENINRITNGTTDQAWLFGSNDIMDDVFALNSQHKLFAPKYVKRGHHIEFDKTTITTTEYWLQFLKTENTNDETCQEMVECLSKNVNLVSFDETLYEHFDYIIVNPMHTDYNRIIEFVTSAEENGDEKIIKLSPNSKYYDKLRGFLLIGKLFYEMNEAVDAE